MIKCILVYSADRIEIIYNFEDDFKRCMDYVTGFEVADQERGDGING